MQFNEYQEKAARTINKSLEKTSIELHGLFGLCSEVGEVLGLYQKALQGHLIEKEHLVKELGDVLWMIAEICTANNISLDTVALINIDKLLARYPEGFTTEKSLHRAENDI